MVAPLAYFPPWIPEDDLLLKNAVEGGASLESLAKGAVSFSRQYSIREIRDRWYSLLYDPDISVEAAARMTEIDLSASVAPKSNRPTNLRAKDYLPKKSKQDNVRSHYYAMKKRICNTRPTFVEEGCHLPEIDHLGDICRELHSHQIDEIVPPPCSFDNFSMEGTHLNGGCISDRIMSNGSLYEYSGHSISPVAIENVLEGSCIPPSNDGSFGKDISQILAHSPTSLQAGFCMQEPSLQQPFGMSDIFGDHDLKPPAAYEDGSVPSHFAEHQKFSSAGTDFIVPFGHSDYSASQHTHPVWNAEGVISTTITTTISNTNCNMDEQLHQAFNSDPAVNDKKNESPVLNGILEGISAESRDPHAIDDGFTIPQGDFMDFSNTLMNFDNDDLLYMSIDRNDKACFDGINLLLNSPNDIHLNDSTNLVEAEETIQTDSCFQIPEGSSEAADITVAAEPVHFDSHDCQSNLASDLPSSSSNPFDLPDGMVTLICQTNKEDDVIPSNDDLFSPLTTHAHLPPPSMPKHYQTNEFVSSSAKGAFGCNLSKVEARSMKRDCFSLGESVPSRTILSANLHSDDIACGERAKMEIPYVDSSLYPSPGGDDQKVGILSSSSKKAKIQGTQETLVISQSGKSGLSFPSNVTNMEHFVQGVSSSKYHDLVEKLPKRDVNLPFGATGDAVLPGMATLTNGGISMNGPEELCGLERVTSFSTLDIDEMSSDSDDDVPYFSDVEAMILDMDLASDDHEMYFAREESRHKFQSIQKSITRLEQAASAGLHRAATHEGAYAVIYGRHLRQYIKKAEVSLGRATIDGYVDINLIKEGHPPYVTNISRRQAIIKLDDWGSFYIKNIGRAKIFINGKEVATGQRFLLISGCLIQIKGLVFIFETNPKLIRQYAASVAEKKMQDKIVESNTNQSVQVQ